jgi:NADH:ubiquinone oxidoreductase subunit 5 (subunit L)/multisubunit Na+/H+ antiporter MnhA subunit
VENISFDFLIMNISVGRRSLAFFHLLIHALFRAKIFICAGGVIYSIGDSQGIRFMGRLSVIFLLLLRV